MDVKAGQPLPCLAYHLILEAIIVELQSCLFEVALECISF